MEIISINRRFFYFRKNIAPVVATTLCGLLFIIIGSCFSSFLYRKEMINVENPVIFASQEVKIFNKKGDKEVGYLELSKLKPGLKPATGEEDVETNIPSTVHDKQGTEGLYGTIKVLAISGANIVIRNVKITGIENQENIDVEKQNIYVAIKEISGSAKSLVEKEINLTELNSSNEKVELTFYVWLSGKASKSLESATISFEIYFE